MSFKELFGVDFDDFGTETKPTKTKPAKPEAEQTAKPKKTEKQAVTAKVILPVTVYAPTFETTIMPNEGEEEGSTITSQELAKRLNDLGFVEINNLHRELYIPENGNVAYVVNGNSESLAVGTDTLVDLSDNKSVIFAYGMEKAMYTAEDFEGKELDEIDLKMVKKAVIAAMPKFKDATFGYDIESNVIVPLFKYTKQVQGKTKVSLPITVPFLGVERTISEECFGNETEPTANDVVNYLAKDILCEGLNITLFQTGEDFFVEFSSSKKLSGSANDLKNNKGANAQKKQKKYVLPFTVYLTMNGHREELTPELFDGKEKITDDDITAYYSNKFTVFKSAEKVKGLHFTYDKMANILTVDSTPGRRGAGKIYNAAYDFEETEHYVNGDGTRIISSSAELQRILQDPGVSVRNGYISNASTPWNKYDVYSNRMATYLYKKESGAIPEQVNAVLKIPKIPGSIYTDIVQYFKNNLPNEAICRILYDHKAGIHYIDYPTEQHASRATVSSMFNPTPHTCDVALTIHSHNRLPAYFSEMDDEAERYDIGMFGVMGRLDQDTPETKIRIAVEGGFTEVSPLFIFKEMK